MAMRYIKQHAQSVINVYDGSLPLAHFLKNYFKKHPKLGSRDRKMIGGMVYSWYRCAHGFHNSLSIEDSIQFALFLCADVPERLLSFLPADWQQHTALPIAEKISLLADNDVPFSMQQLLPFDAHFSEGIDKQDYLLSMLQQPALFIRVRNNRNAEIEKLLTDNAIAFAQINSVCYSLRNGAPIDKFLPNDAYVVQDLSSQNTGQFFHPKPNEIWWDCCSGAGGKSLLLKDIEPTVQLSVSDTRGSILHNLQERFRLYRHNKPQQYVVDATNALALQQALTNKRFQRIICDVPCTGSGTWARTPEQLYFFSAALIEEYAERQKKIARNAALYLQEGGKLVYITCSIFRQENEAVVEWLLANNDKLELKSMQLINGIAQKADSMFVAVIMKK